MSGPKVVNIQAVRRQQRRQCAALLRELTEAVEACLRLQQTESAAPTEFRARSEAVLAQLNGLWEKEQWPELQRQTVAQRDFYRSEAENRRQRVIEQRAALLRREHRLRRAAVQISEELARLPGSEARDNLLKQLSNDREQSGMQMAVEQGLEFISAVRRDSAAADRAERVRELAAGYIEPSEAEAASAALPEADRDPDEMRLDRCLVLLGELEIEEAESVVIESWKEKARRAGAMTEAERTLVLDSLALELSTHLRDRRAAAAAVAAAKTLLAELEVRSTPTAMVWKGRLDEAIEQRHKRERLEELTASAREWLEGEIQREDAAEQRQAVLQALSSRGYEVREGMAAAWTEHGRVVVKKPQETLYGVELSAASAGSAFQVRVVATRPVMRDQQRDLEIEQTWCGEFARLQSLLAAEGFPTQLAVAQAPGAVPIKTVGDPVAAAAEEARRRQAEETRTKREVGL